MTKRKSLLESVARAIARDYWGADYFQEDSWTEWRIEAKSAIKAVREFDRRRGKRKKT